jgi:hypothetical protein
VVPQRVEAPRQPATGGWRNWLSDERADVLRRGYPAGVQMHELRAQMEPLPGGPLPDSTTVALAANALKLRRPDGFKSSVMMKRQPQPPVALAHADDLVTRDPPLVRPLAESLFWLTDARRAALVEGWPAGIETSELMRTMETLPGPPLPSYTRVVNAASGYLKLRRPVGFLAARGRQGAGEPSAEKNPAAVALGHKGGLVGGVARAANMTPDERSAAAKLAAEARWAKTADVPQPDVPATPVTAGPPPTEAALAPAARESAETGATTAPASVVLLPRAGSPSPRAEDTPKVRIADFVQIEQWAAQRGIMFNGDNLDEVNRVARRVGAPQFELRINRRALAR